MRFKIIQKQTLSKVTEDDLLNLIFQDSRNSNLSFLYKIISLDKNRVDSIQIYCYGTKNTFRMRKADVLKELNSGNYISYRD